MNKLLRRLRKEEQGSATIEFLALALPLFIPLFIFLNQYALQSDTEASMRTLGREMARAFVLSENDEVAARVTEEVFQKGSDVLGFANDARSGDLSYSYQCESSPCISPDNRVEIRLNSKRAGRAFFAVEYVSPWA